MIHKNKKSNKNKKLFLVLASILVVVVIGASIFTLNRRAQNNQQPTPAGFTNQPQSLNMDPPTEEEKQAVDETKDRIVQELEKNANPGNQDKKVVTPIITYADKYGDNVEIGAYVDGVIENGGTCTATLSRGGAAITGSSTGVADASSTACPVIIIPASKFSSGTWQLVVNYSSANSNGTSNSREVTLNL